MSLVRSRGALLALALASPPALSPAVAGLLPLRPGMAVVTCAPDIGAVPPMPWVMGIVDTRSPECVLEARRGEHWPAPMDHNELPNGTMNEADQWSIDVLGPAFGLALDDAPAPNIYVTAARVYGGTALAHGRIHRVDGMTGEISVLATLTTAETAGLGNVAFDARHRQLFVTNLDDGRIYRIGLDGTQLGSFDPFDTDNGEPGLAPLEERIWGVATDGSRVYFGTWSEDLTYRTFVSNSVLSVALDAGGGFTGRERVELVLPEIRTMGGTQPIADIALGSDGTHLFLAERTMAGESPLAHRSRVLEYVLSPLGTWEPSAREYAIGIDDGGSFFGENASGGVDVDECVDDAACPTAGPKLYATGDALVFDWMTPIFAYGLQVTPLAGGGALDSWIIDLDDDVVSQDKTDLGDVEVYRHLRTPQDDPPPEFDIVWAEDPSDCNLGIRVSWEEALFGGTGLGTYRVYRSELSCADALSRPPLVSGLTELYWVDTGTEHLHEYHHVVEAVGTASPAGTCRIVGPDPVTAVCVDPPVLEFADPTLPAPVWDALRASHDADAVTLSWWSARPLLPEEHFHLLKAWADPTDVFRVVNGEGFFGLSFTELDPSSPLQFFDLRVADRCENQSDDEYPAGY